MFGGGRNPVVTAVLQSTPKVKVSIKSLSEIPGNAGSDCKQHAKRSIFSPARNNCRGNVHQNVMAMHQTVIRPMLSMHSI